MRSQTSSKPQTKGDTAKATLCERSQSQIVSKEEEESYYEKGLERAYFYNMIHS